MIDKILPNDQATERTVLGTIMISAVAAAQCFEYLKPGDFYHSEHQKIFIAMQTINEHEKPIDIITLSAELSNNGNFEIGYLGELAENIAVSANIEHYIKILLDKSARRRLIDLLSIAQNELFEGDIALERHAGYIGEIAQTSSELVERINKEELDRAKLIEPSTMTEKMINYNQGGILIHGEDCGWPSLYKHYRPARGTLNIITGCPTHGKSEFMDALAVNLSLSAQWRWCVFSPENYPTEIHLRKIIEKYIGKNIKDMVADEIKKAMEWINLYFRFVQLSENNHTAEALMRLIDKPVKEKQFDALLIDPWNELDITQADEQRETDYIGRALSRIRRYARRNNIAVYIVAHPAKMYRNKQTGTYDVPTLYDISGSAHWFNKADNGLTIYRDIDKETGLLKDEIQIHVQKIKFKAHGTQGLLSLLYDKNSGKFYEPESQTKEW